MYLPKQRPFLGHGIGLRVPHYEAALAGQLPVDWVECITENFLGGGGRPLAVLEAVAQRLPVVFHGVSLGIGSVSGVDRDYLRQVSRLFERWDPPWVSDHLCWTHLKGHHSHDLLPLPHTREALATVVKNVRAVQAQLGRPFLLENVSSYLTYRIQELTEWEFLAEVAEQADCGILLDLNNVLVNAFNHGFDPQEYVRGLPTQRVWQLHLANHTDYPGYKFDSHSGPVRPELWQFYRWAVGQLGAVSSLIEWDEEIPSLEVLCAESHEAARIAEGAGSGSASLQ